jgi:hypothetical protein
LNVAAQIPNSNPMLYVNACRPAWSDSLTTYCREIFDYASSGVAYDKKTNKWYSVSQGGHSLNDQSGAYEGDTLSGQVRSVQASTVHTRTADSNANNTPQAGQYAFSDGRRTAGHNGAGHQVVYRRDGQRVVVMAHTFAQTVVSGGIPYATTGFWPDRAGEKFDLYQSGGTGWGWLPTDLASSGRVYPGTTYDDRLGRVWVWNGDGRVFYLDPHLTSGQPTWTLFANLGPTNQGNDAGLTLDQKRYRLVSFRGPSPNQVMTLDSRTGAFAVHDVTVPSGYEFLLRPNPGDGQYPHAALVYDWFNDVYVWGCFATQPHNFPATVYGTLNPTTWAITVLGATENTITQAPWTIERFMFMPLMGGIHLMDDATIPQKYIRRI